MRIGSFDISGSWIRKKLYLQTHMLWLDNTYIEIENVGKILEYNDIRIRLMTSTLILDIWGEKLTVSSYGTAGVCVNGKISSVEFTPKKNGAGREKDNA